MAEQQRDRGLYGRDIQYRRDLLVVREMARRPGNSRAPHILLLIVYVAALSIGNHLLALLVGPAVLGVRRADTAWRAGGDRDERRMEWTEWATLTALWIVLVGVGLGNLLLLVVGGLLLLAAAAACMVSGSRAFPVLAIGIAGRRDFDLRVLYIRAGLHPLLNEADPEHWRPLLASSGASSSGAAACWTIP